MADVHAELQALRARMDELARENDELRSHLLKGGALPQAGSWTSEIDPRVDLPHAELRRRRARGRVIAIVLLGLGLGVGLVTASAISRTFAQGDEHRIEATSRFRWEDVPEIGVMVDPPGGVTIVKHPEKGKMIVDTIALPGERVAPPRPIRPAVPPVPRSARTRVHPPEPAPR